MSRTHLQNYVAPPRVPRSRATGQRGSGAPHCWELISSGALIIAPVCSLLVILSIWLLPRDPWQHLGCCGLDSLSGLPWAEGPDVLEDAPVLRVRPDAAIFEGHTVDDGPRSHDDHVDPDWKVSKLDDLLDFKRETWQLLHPGKTWRESMLLVADRDLPAKALRRYFYTIQLSLGDRLQLATLAKGQRIAAAWVTLVPLERWAPVHHEGPHTLNLEDFATYNALVQEVVARRKAGKPVFLSLL